MNYVKKILEKVILSIPLLNQNVNVYKLLGVRCINEGGGDWLIL